jgi:hypothetical protein
MIRLLKARFVAQVARWLMQYQGKDILTSSAIRLPGQRAMTSS